MFFQHNLFGKISVFVLHKLFFISYPVPNVICLYMSIRMTKNLYLHGNGYQLQ